MSTAFEELDERSRIIFSSVVQSFLDTGEPIGSRTLSRATGLNLSPATIRNIMADLEDIGLIRAPHRSAGRLPSQTGLRFYIDGLMEIGGLNAEERNAIEAKCTTAGHSMREMYEQTSTVLSGLSSSIGLVMAPKLEKPLKQIQFIPLSPGRILAVIVSQDGMVENRVLETSSDVPTSALISASNYLNAHIAGKTLAEARKTIAKDITAQKTQLDQLSQNLVEQGLATKPNPDDMTLVVRGQKNLLNNITALEDIDHVRRLFEVLEEKESMLKILENTQSADGVQIFIGSENKAFEHEGLSMIISPYRNTEEQVIGAIGVIGPTRLNYGRLIPIVDYTSQVISKLIG